MVSGRAISPPAYSKVTSPPLTEAPSAAWGSESVMLPLMISFSSLQEEKAAQKSAHAQLSAWNLLVFIRFFV